MTGNALEEKTRSNSKKGAETYSSAIESASNYHGWILDEFAPFIGNKVLEVGLGHGNYRKQLDKSISYIGIDIDPISVANAPKFSDSDKFICADIAKPDFTHLVPGGLDSVVCINVIEHIEDDQAAVSNLVSVLRPGGYVLLFVPAFEMLYNDLDSLAGHYRRYNLSDLKRLAERAGAQAHKCYYFNPVGGLGWFANKFVRHESLNEDSVNGQIELFDRYILPFSRVLNSISGPFFGQSAIMVARKR
jgi:SAM-dependent methyltransferase